MTLVTEQAKVCERLIRLVELGFPELGDLFDDPTCRTAREVLRIAPTARVATRRRTSTLANANAGPGHRRLACSGRLKANGRAPRRLVTLAGEVELRRQRYRCLDCGVEVVPLDAALGLEPRTAHMLGVRECGL